MAYLYRLLPPRPTFGPADMSPEEAEVMQRHGAYWQEQVERDVAVAFGPVLDPKGSWGLALLDLDDEDAARGAADDDPAVQSGTCTYELLPMQLFKRD